MFKIQVKGYLVIIYRSLKVVGWVMARLVEVITSLKICSLWMEHCINQEFLNSAKLSKLKLSKMSLSISKWESFTWLFLFPLCQTTETPRAKHSTIDDHRCVFRYIHSTILLTPSRPSFEILFGLLYSSFLLSCVKNSCIFFWRLRKLMFFIID